MKPNKKRGRPFLVIPNAALKAALNAGHISEPDIKAACLTATDRLFTIGTGDSPKLIETLLRSLDEISVKTISESISPDVSLRYLQRLSKCCIKAAGLLSIHLS
ncbi:hypothetical protein XV62_003174 [Escherichia coli]|nr:hypothetical protein [Escherichia coli]EFL5600508.1 hypothetical protein [Escherichia coli]EGK5685451.1 hypothetical protein [Escherichia coli]